MDFNVLKSSDYRIDCDRDEVASRMVAMTLPLSSHAPSTPEAAESKSRTRKEKKEKRTKEKKSKKSHRKVKLAEPQATSPSSSSTTLPPATVEDKGKKRDNINGGKGPDAHRVVVVEPSSSESYSTPSILELIFAAPKPNAVDLAEYPLHVDPSSTVAEIKEQLFQRERYLQRTMKFYYEGRELQVRGWLS